MYQQPTASGVPSALENHRASAYSLTTLIAQTEYILRSLLQLSTTQFEALKSPQLAVDGIFNSSASIPAAVNLRYRSTVLADTTDSVYTKNIFSAEDADCQLDDLIDEVGEAEEGLTPVGIEDEEYTSIASGEDILSGYLGSGDENYATLDLPPHEMYLNSLFNTEVDVAQLYDPKLRREGVGILFYEVSYYERQSADVIIEPEGEVTEIEVLSAVSTSSGEDSEPDEDPERGDLESRLGFRKAA